MKVVSETEKHLGTSIEIKLMERDSSFFSSCFQELIRIEELYSRFKISSKLSQVNSQLGKWHTISDEFFFLLKSAEEVKKKSLGYFDITIKETLDSLGYNKEYSFTEKKLKKNILQKVKSFLPAIELDEKNKKVLLRKEIDLGGIGKGYALDAVGKILQSQGVSTYYINAGGDILVKGEEPWEILLEHPDDPTRIIGKISLQNSAIAGSSSNRRKWGKHHHLINPKTQKPENSVKAIFVLHKQGMFADAYATAFFTAGFEEGIFLSQQLELPILMISSENKMYCSPDFAVEFYDEK